MVISKIYAHHNGGKRSGFALSPLCNAGSMPGAKPFQGGSEALGIGNTTRRSLQYSYALLGKKEKKKKRFYCSVVGCVMLSASQVVGIRVMWRCRERGDSVRRALGMTRGR